MGSTAESSLFNPQIVLLKNIFQRAPQCLPEVKKKHKRTVKADHLDAPEKPFKCKTNTLARNPAKLDEARYGRDMKWDGF